MMITEIHSRESQGKTILDICQWVQSVPIYPSIVEAIQSAHSHGCELRIISNANEFFIEKILERHELLGCFSKITTNPTRTDGEGRLRILPYHDLSSPHGCNICLPNMCKGLVIDKLPRESDSESGKRRTIYVGDGVGNFCGVLRLANRDHMSCQRRTILCGSAFARTENKSRLIYMSGATGNGDELRNILLDLINAKYITAY